MDILAAVWAAHNPGDTLHYSESQEEPVGDFRRSRWKQYWIRVLNSSSQLHICVTVFIQEAAKRRVMSSGEEGRTGALVMGTDDQLM